jgi:hypothetical protein
LLPEVLKFVPCGDGDGLVKIAPGEFLCSTSQFCERLRNASDSNCDGEAWQDDSDR